MNHISFSKKKFNSLLVTASITMVVSYLTTLSDILITGIFVGEAAIAAVNMLTPIVGILYFASGIISMGSQYMYCEEIGKFRRDRAEEIFTQGFVLSAALGVVFFAALIVFRDPYINYLGISKEIATELRLYWKYMIWAGLTIPLQFFIGNIVYADGDEFLTLMGNIALVGGNIVASIFLTYKLGTLGAGLGTFLGNAVSTLVMAFHFLKKENNLKLKLHFSLKDIKQMWKLSCLDVSSYLCWGLLNMIVTKIILSSFGESYTAVFGIAFNILEMSLIFEGIGGALNPIAEIYVAEKNYDSERELVGYASKIALAEGLLFAVILIIVAPFIPSVFGLENEALSAECVKAVRYIACSLPFLALNYAISSQYLIVRRIAMATVMMVVSLLGVNVILCVVLSKFMGLDGIWLSFAVSTFISQIGILLYVYKKFGKEMFPWLVPQNHCPTFDKSVTITEENVLFARDAACSFLQENNISDSVVKQTMILFEEYGMTALDKNFGKSVIAQYTIRIENDKLKLFFRDNGAIFDISDADTRITSFRAYIVASVMETYRNKKYLTTVGYNRLMLEIDL